MSNLIISIVVAALILGGPLTLFAIIKILARYFSAPKVRLVKLEDAPFAIAVDWDNETNPVAVYRVRVDFAELVRGGRSASFSVTFADKASRKKSFVVPVQISENELTMLTDTPADPRALRNSSVLIEVETADNQATRLTLSKKKVQKLLAQAWTPTDGIEKLAPAKPDDWSLLTRVFPWKKAAAEAAAKALENPAGATLAATPAKPKEATQVQIADFIVTKVWIEPGCIVCDACENEAPEVFKVTADTCIVVPDANLSNALSIKAAAEGCPVDVIKYDTKPAA